jgi:hypothetical protein
MNVLSSSKDCVVVNKGEDTLHSRDTCVQVKKVAASATTSKQVSVAPKEKNTDNGNSKLPSADYKVPLVPFSRFIL